MKRHLLAMALALVLTLSLAITAAAAPINNPHAETFTGTCDGDQVTVVVTRGQPGHIVGSTSKLIPTAFTFAGIFTPEVGSPILVKESETVGQGRRVGQQDALVTCVFPITFTEPGEGTFVGTITVEAFRTPRGK